MAYTVKLTALAEADAYAAYGYLQGYSHQIAEAWLRKLFVVIQTLDEMPTRCPIIAEADEIGYPARQLLYGKSPNIYRIIFDTQEFPRQEPTVRILRLWHGARDRITLQDLDANE